MKSILIIEDDRDTRETLQSYLKIEGYDVISAENGLKGLEKLDEVAIGPSLIFVDLFMPQMSGLDFLKNYSELYSESRIVLISACPVDNPDFIEAQSYSDFAISKPFDLNQVLDLARQYVH